MMRRPTEQDTECSGILDSFEFIGLPSDLCEVARPFHELAHSIKLGFPALPEKLAVLRALKNFQDAAVKQARAQQLHQPTNERKSA